MSLNLGSIMEQFCGLEQDTDPLFSFIGKRVIMISVPKGLSRGLNKIKC